MRCSPFIRRLPSLYLRVLPLPPSPAVSLSLSVERGELGEGGATVSFATVFLTLANELGGGRMPPRRGISVSMGYLFNLRIRRLVTRRRNCPRPSPCISTPSFFFFPKNGSGFPIHCRGRIVVFFRYMIRLTDGRTNVVDFRIPVSRFVVCVLLHKLSSENHGCTGL